MIYRATYLRFLIFTGAFLALALVLRCFRRRKASARIFSGLIGSTVGFIITPPLAVALGLMSFAWIDPGYFGGLFLYCPNPIECFKVHFLTAVGVLAGFAIGCWVFSRRAMPSPKPADPVLLIAPWLAAPFVASVVTTGLGERISNELQGLGIPGVPPVLRASGAIGISFLLCALTWAFQKERFNGNEGTELTIKAMKRGTKVASIQFGYACMGIVLCWFSLQSF
jgi:hypothetical protein